MDLVDGLVAAHALAELERLRFEQSGQLVRSDVDDAVAVTLAEVSRHHAWRSAQWGDLIREPLPPLVAERAASAVEDLVPPPSSAALTDVGVAAWLTAELADLINRVEAMASGLDPVGDGSLVRTAARVLEDLRSDQRLLSERSR